MATRNWWLMKQTEWERVFEWMSARDDKKPKHQAGEQRRSLNYCDKWRCDGKTVCRTFLLQQLTSNGIICTFTLHRKWTHFLEMISYLSLCLCLFCFKSVILLAKKNPVSTATREKNIHSISDSRTYSWKATSIWTRYHFSMNKPQLIAFEIPHTHTCART